MQQLEYDIYSYLSQQYELANEKDPLARASLEIDPLVMPQEYLLLRKLKMFSGKNGGLPLLVDGGYFDQPHFTLKVLEACSNGERLYEDFLKQRNDQELLALLQNRQAAGFSEGSENLV